MSVFRAEARNGWFFAAPWLIGFSVFLLFPLLFSLYVSFCDYSVLRSPVWIGVDNYTKLMGDQLFHTTLWNTLYFGVGSLGLGTVVAIALAMLLNNKVRGMAFYRTIFFIPSLVPMIALGVLWLWVFNGEYGLLNAFLGNFMASPPNWIGDPAWSKITLIIIAVWGTGHAMVIYLAGLQQVPTALYESAEIDGARKWARTRHITLPMLSPVILFNVIVGLIGTLQVFAVPYVMFPNGQPARSTYFLTSYLFDNAFRFQKMGYASAIGWVMFAITFVLTMISLKVSERYVHYEGG